MTLAAILLNVSFIFLTMPAATTVAQASSQPADKPGATATQDQDNSQQKTNPSAATQAAPEANPQQPASPTPSAAKKSSTPARPASRPKHKKGVPPTNCNPTPAVSPAAPADPASSDKSASNPTASTPGTAPAAAPSPAPTNCPPSKIVVRQGSASEPTIQLVGGSGGAPERNTATQMLQSAEDNLKKINGQSLSSSQRDMIAQVRQFMDQSKTATAAGDLERARTLAWKAQTLSEELANPQR